MAQPATAAPQPGQQQQQRPQPQKLNQMEFQTIYPQYIDSTATPSLGRRLTAKNSVAKPTLQEMFNALVEMGYKPVFADPTKSLPCTQSRLEVFPPPRGCIRVAIKEPAARSTSPTTRKATNDKFATKGQVLKELAARIAKIPDRKVEEKSRDQMMYEAHMEQLSAELAKNKKGMNLGGGGQKQKMKVVRR